MMSCDHCYHGNIPSPIGVMYVGFHIALRGWVRGGEEEGDDFCVTYSTFTMLTYPKRTSTQVGLQIPRTAAVPMRPV